MKMQLFVVATWLLSAATNLFGAETNVVYLPVDWSAHVGEKDIAEQIDTAKGKPECRPAEFDPQGNWGPVVSGFQISIRLATNTFRVGSMINARVILRNTETNSLTIIAPSVAGIRLVATDEHGVLLQPNRLQLTVSGPSQATLPGRRQRSYEFDLAQNFDFKSPTTCRAEHLIRLDQTAKVCSGDARITIVP